MNATIAFHAHIIKTRSADDAQYKASIKALRARGIFAV